MRPSLVVETRPTITQFFLAEQRKVPGATGEFTAVINHIRLACKRIGNAVTRNRIKRRTRDWLRRHGWAPVGKDVVLIAKEAAATLSTPALQADLRRLFERIASC